MTARVATIALALLAPLASGALRRASGRQADDGKALYDWVTGSRRSTRRRRSDAA